MLEIDADVKHVLLTVRLVSVCGQRLPIPITSELSCQSEAAAAVLFAHHIQGDYAQTRSACQQHQCM
jgi:hypothetical protein